MSIKHGSDNFKTSKVICQIQKGIWKSNIVLMFKLLQKIPTFGYSFHFVDLQLQFFLRIIIS